MSGNGEALFFDAPDSVKGDGTQADIPSDTFADPLSGLVTAGAPGQTISPPGSEEHHLEIPGPVQHDPEVVSRMVNAAMLAEDQPARTPGTDQPVEFSPTKIVSTVGDQGTPPIGMLPQQRTWPSRPPQLLRQPRRARQEEPLEVDEEAEVEVRRAKTAMQFPKLGKPSSNTTGVMIAISLMIVFAVLAIQLLASLFNSVSGLFG
ncbi:hypothetical protein [Amycolatopsis sp. lyj-112]|uniref:hypothetical protein n=1 Tax=Amycolatopsis sp. lyj-112 TaxID=2789288 RepID=UPI00397CFDB3